MSISKFSATAAFFVALVNFSNNAHATPPESCFQSKMDYEVYLYWGDSTPYDKYENKNAEPVYKYFGQSKQTIDDIEKVKAATKHGPAKRKPITITTKEVTVNGKPYLDASESTTPSGEKSYFWQAVDEKSIMDSTSKFPLTPAGTEYLFNLTVSDPVCGAKVVKQLKLHIH